MNDQQKPKRSSPLAVGCFSILAILAIFAIIGVLSGGGDDGVSTNPAPTTAPTTPGPTRTLPSVSDTPASRPVTTRPALPRAATLIKEALGDSNRNAPMRLDVKYAERVIVVHWGINENLTEGLTKDTARSEGLTIIKAVRGSSEYAKANTVRLVGSYAMVDQLGNTSENVVIRATYPKTLIEKINFDGFNFKNV